MRIINCTATNFQSYENIEFSYTNLGLSLISGPTGAGKSTVLDLIPWILYGQTSKEGAANDVLSWSVDEATFATATVELPDATILVFRKRGKSGQNDLYWLEDLGLPPTRGKDLNDTQRLLEARLGVSAELFLLGSYMTQFSKADSFFIAKAKDRRQVLEQIADQEFAVTLSEKTSEERKAAKTTVQSLTTDLATLESRTSTLLESLQYLNNSSKMWDASLEKKIKDTQQKFEDFDRTKEATISATKDKVDSWHRAQVQKQQDLETQLLELPPINDWASYGMAISDARQRLEELKDTRCDKCGSLESSDLRATLTEELGLLVTADKENEQLKKERARLEKTLQEANNALNPYLDSLLQAKAQTNPHGSQLRMIQAETNPFHAQIQDTETKLDKTRIKYDQVATAKTAVSRLYSLLDWLYEKSFELRGIMMSRAVSQIQDKTNYYLEKYFDAPLRIELVLDGSDKLEVNISNEGHQAPFKQLSGGERCLLKLAFSLSLMRAAQDKSGISFNIIMLDEALNGLDENLKVKAFALLQELEKEYQSILVIDHCEEFKNLFNNKFIVDKQDGHSTIKGDE